MAKINNIRKDKPNSILCKKIECPRKFYVLGIPIIFLIALAPVVEAGCSCSVGVWDPSAFLNSDEVTSQSAQPSSNQNSAAVSPGGNTQKKLDRLDSFPNGQIFKPMKSVSSSDMVLDVSNGESYAKSHIKKAIHIPTISFLDDDGNLRTDEELAKVLGGAGVSRNDSIVLYGNMESSGEAEFAFLVLSYLGQKDIRLLDGSLADWQAAGLPVESSEDKLPATEYKHEVKTDVIAEYEFVKSGQAQILDVRPFVDFGKGRIPGSIALDASNVIKGEKIKSGNDLSLVFSRLAKDKPIVVYSNDYSRSSLVWLGLQLMGYEASIYTWENWNAHKSSNTQAATSQAGEATANSKYFKLGNT